MRFSRSAHRPRHVALPMTSLIDVVFLLLIYFVVTARFAASETELASGIQSGSASEPGEPPVTLRVLSRDADARFQIGARRLNNASALADLLRRVASDTGVAIEVADEARIADAAAALQAANDARLDSITYVPAP
ncbi:MAG: biopolymer transporter ExbD [Planctomycetota bacterium]